MGYARQSIVSLNDTPYYHLIARCVRRAWLWGVDEYAGRDYSHRKDWIIERIGFLSRIFAIDVCAYAVMSNHYHLVVRVDLEGFRQCTPAEIIDRWSRLFTIPLIVKRWQQGIASEIEAEIALRRIELWRARLIDVSWFMRCLNEYLARRANAEDQCTGRFWEGRFKSQALLDEAGLLTAMAYVDLNPIRAGIASTPEESEFTSIYQRIRQIKASAATTAVPMQLPAIKLMPFADQAGDHTAIPFHALDYLQLVDWTGRSERADKRGSIDSRAPPILQRLNIDPNVWQEAMHIRGNVFGRALGKLDHLRLHAKAIRQQRIKGLQQAERLFGAG